jgi:hypothetical protein
MSAPETFLEGSELVLVAQVPRAGGRRGRWHQVHFNLEVMRRFFRFDPQDEEAEGIFERVARDGTYGGSRARRLVYSAVNKNLKIEFDLPDARDYPDELPPLLLLLEISLRRFRYLLLLPADDGYEEMRRLNESLDSIGRGLRRSLTTLDEVELRWPECPLRHPGSARSERT